MRTVLRVASPGQTCHWAMPRQATIAAIIGLIANLAVTAERAVQQPVVVGTPESVPSVKSLVDAPWQELHFAASKLFLQARTVLSLAIATPEEVNAALRPPPTGTAVTAGAGPFALLTVRSELPFGRRDTTRVWLDATRAATLQADRLISGRNPYHKTLRYCTEGIYMWRDAPSVPPAAF